jgi:hypothetical protein
LRDVVKTLRDQALDRAMRELARQVEQPGIGDDERLALARRGYELRLQKLQPLSGGPAPAQGPGSAPPH